MDITPGKDLFSTGLSQSNHLTVLRTTTGNYVAHSVGTGSSAVWVWTPGSLVHGFECSGAAFWVCLHRHSEYGGSTS
jgi:hypothetical protein